MWNSALYRSPELRIVAAAAIAAVALGLALLAGVAERTDVLMLDFREWRPAGPRTDPGVAEFFRKVQVAPPARRPFQITLQLAHPGSPSDFLAAERRYEVAGDGCYQFQVYLWSPKPVDTARALIYVNDEIAWSGPLPEVSHGGSVAIRGFHPRQGKVKIRLELRANPRAAPVSPAPSVRFEYATLQRCRSGGHEERAGA